MRTFGVEEELLIVSADSGWPLPLARAVLDAAARSGPGSCPGPALTTEFKQEQIEVNTRPCETAEGLRAEIVAGRSLADDAARTVGARIAASGTPPLMHTTPTEGDQRYSTLSRRFGMVAREQITCGFHVHVSVDSRDEGVAVLDRIRPWLPVLLALSANSPFWNGEDTGFASYRTQIWSRWPSAGPAELFGTAAGYDATIARLIRTGVLLDEGMVYFDARLCRHQPTVEVRIADICLRADDAVVLAAAVRALVETAAAEWLAGVPAPAVRTDTLRLADWQASRFGLRGELLDAATGDPRPASAVVEDFAAHLEAALDGAGDLPLVRDGIARIRERGSGERLQRQAFGGGLASDVVAAIVEATHAHARRPEPEPFD
ncbi:glutamate--cysteine ligase [Arthrobacter woluwensis]|uniref:glutamate--cysteine ligase n=1 Tax=Arthrobacter woluwensis TaxID=156980 RepID=UPI0011A429D4|nr:glutamate--cysteine ligase [Arthrobacter woluwensis]